MSAFTSLHFIFIMNKETIVTSCAVLCVGKLSPANQLEAGASGRVKVRGCCDWTEGGGGQGRVTLLWPDRIPGVLVSGGRRLAVCVWFEEGG